MKHLSPLFALVFILTACGESTSDEELPEGAAPTDAQREEPAAPETPASDTTEPEATEEEPATDPAVDGVPEVPEPAAEEDAERSSIAGLSYVLPEGWTVGPPKTMRLLTLLPVGVEDADLAISKWPGDVGGFPMNVNRWARQAGLPPFPNLMTAATSDFEQFQIDDTTATWVPLMNEDTNIAILAVWVPRGPEPEDPVETWTFKLTCKADQVQQLAPDVRAFCESIEFED